MDFKLSEILYESPYIKTPLNKNVKIIFADDTASGRPCKMIDDIMQRKILPYYSNTHSNAFCGIKFKNLITKTREMVRKTFNLTDSHKVIFTGNGATGAINHMAKSINFKKYKKVHIFMSSYEHYSNHLPWVEISKETGNENVEINIIPMKDDDIDIEYLDSELDKITDCDDLSIVTVTACSNVTGVITKIDEITEIVKKNNIKNTIGKTVLFLDCACLGPYKFINCKDVDVAFISMHKFLGGTGTPGVLIAKEELFIEGHPYNPGGGCVKKANSTQIIYEDDIEKKESGGTPNIAGTVRIYYVLKLRNKYIEAIEHNEKEIVTYVHKKLEEMTKIYPKLKIIMLSKFLDRRLPIISFAINDLHYNFIVVLLNDLFGIQSRGGISCCGMFGEYMKDTCDINGWCRVSFNWMMRKDTIDYILNAIVVVLKYGNKFLKLYTHDTKANLFIYSGKEEYDIPTSTFV